MTVRMGSGLLVPAGAQVVPPAGQPRRVLSVPGEDLRLANGRRLRYQGARFLGDLDDPGAPPLLVSWWLSKDGLKVLASLDDTGVNGKPWGWLLHVSISRATRYPDLIADLIPVRDVFYGPDVDCMMVMPRASDYINRHEFCMQIWQCPEGWGMQ